MNKFQKYRYDKKTQKIENNLPQWSVTSVPKKTIINIMKILKSMNKIEMIEFLNNTKEDFVCKVLVYIYFNHAEDNMWGGKMSVFISSYYSSLKKVAIKNEIKLTPAIIIENINYKTVKEINKDLGNHSNLINYINNYNQDIADEIHGYIVTDIFIKNMKKLKEINNFEYLGESIVNFKLKNKIKNF